MARSSVVIKRSDASNWLITLFILIVAGGAVVTELFQTPVSKPHVFNKYQYLIPTKKMDTYSQIRLENRLGDFTLSLDNAKWRLKEPRNLPANLELVSEIKNGIKGLKIKKIFEKDPINLSNFSLDSPLLKLFLQGGDGLTLEISFGLVDTITNSTYVMLSDKDAIYQVSNISLSLEKLGLSDFIDARVVSMKPEDLVYLKIQKLDKKYYRNQLTLSKNNKGDWVNSSKKALSNEKVFKYLTELTSLRSLFILDKLTPSLEKRLNRYLNNPFFKMELKDKSGKITQYKMSYILSELPDVKMEKKQNFLMWASDREHPFLINRENISFFFKKSRNFKRPPFKKLFY